jgi:hypothetical protein
MNHPGLTRELIRSWTIHHDTFMIATGPAVDKTLPILAAFL